MSHWKNSHYSAAFAYAPECVWPLNAAQVCFIYSLHLATHISSTITLTQMYVSKALVAINRNKPVPLYIGTKRWLQPSWAPSHGLKVINTSSSFSHCSGPGPRRSAVNCLQVSNPSYWCRRHTRRRIAVSLILRLCMSVEGRSDE